MGRSLIERKWREHCPQCGRPQEHLGLCEACEFRETADRSVRLFEAVVKAYRERGETLQQELTCPSCEAARAKAGVVGERRGVPIVRAGCPACGWSAMT